MTVVLVGFMGAGKTTVGRAVAARLGLPFIDADVAIEQGLGRTIRDVFATEGEAFFREVEHQTVTSLVRGPDAVIALGGGALQDARTREALRGTCVVHLRVSYGEALARVRNDGRRPMLQRPDLGTIYQARVPVYEACACVTVDTDGRRTDAVTGDVLASLAPAGPAAP